MKMGKKWIIGAIVVFGLFTAGYVIATRALNHFLVDGLLARLIGKKTAVILGADAGYLPLTWRGMSFRSDGLLARGKPPRSLTEMQVSSLYARCSLQNLWQRKWTITRLQASHLEAAFGRAAAAHLEKILPHDPKLQPQIETNSPLKLDIRETFVPRTDIYWGEVEEAVGYLRDVETRFYPKDHDLDIFGRGGTFRQTGWPELKVDELRMHYAKPKLAVETAILSLGQSKNFRVTGEFDFGAGRGMRFHLSAVQAPAEPFLGKFWQGKLEGVFESESDLEKRSEGDAKMNAAGELHFVRAMVHDVATLKQIAELTRHPQFERPKIDILRTRYKWNGSRLEVTGLEMETKGLFRVEGEFQIEKENIEGKFRIGAASEVVEAIPGAREKVFTESRDGYLWTTMTLQGPVQHPREDLKKRLVAAAEEHFAKGFLAPIFKPGKAMLELLNAIYK
jgi:hypothetical protein